MVTLFYKKLRITIVFCLLHESGPWFVKKLYTLQHRLQHDSFMRMRRTTFSDIGFQREARSGDVHTKLHKEAAESRRSSRLTG